MHTIFGSARIYALRSQRVKDMKDVVWSGDGRFDSMGHLAKYGAYTMFSTSIMKVVHFELVQV